MDFGAIMRFNGNFQSALQSLIGAGEIFKPLINIAERRVGFEIIVVDSPQTLPSGFRSPVAFNEKLSATNDP